MTLVSQKPVQGARMVCRRLRSVPWVILNGPPPILVEIPRGLTVNRTGPNFLGLRWLTIIASVG